MRSPHAEGLGDKVRPPEPARVSLGREQPIPLTPPDELGGARGGGVVARRRDRNPLRPAGGRLLRRQDLERHEEPDDGIDIADEFVECVVLHPLGLIAQVVAALIDGHDVEMLGERRKSGRRS